MNSGYCTGIYMGEMYMVGMKYFSGKEEREKQRLGVWGWQG